MIKIYYKYLKIYKDDFSDTLTFKWQSDIDDLSSSDQLPNCLKYAKMPRKKDEMSNDTLIYILSSSFIISHLLLAETQL